MATTIASTSATATTVTFTDALNININKENHSWVYGNGSYINYEGKELLDINSFKQSISSAIDDFSNENWKAINVGSDVYDPNSELLQTIKLQSDQGSKLTIIKKIDSYLHYENQDEINSTNLTNSDGTIIFATNFISNYTPGAAGSGFYEKQINSFEYYNSGGVGVEDDINAHINLTVEYKVPPHIKLFDGVYTASKIAKVTDKFDAYFLGNGYNLEIKTNLNGNHKKYANFDGSAMAINNVDNVNFIKYKFSDLNDDFMVSISGGNIITNENANYGSSENNSSLISKATLNGVKISNSKYILSATKVLYTDSNRDDLGNHIDLLPNIEGYKLDPVSKIQEIIIQRFVPIVLKNDNVITIKNPDGTEVNAGDGKDTVIGSIGEDTISGGAGSDKLTGGKSTDTFAFSKSDFFTANSKGVEVYNKSVDAITDFNIKEGDLLDFGDLGQLEFYTKLKDAQASNAHLFYIKGTNKIYLNTDTTDSHYTATVIITLTGNIQVNDSMSNFNYPVTA